MAERVVFKFSQHPLRPFKIKIKKKKKELLCAILAKLFLKTLAVKVLPLIELISEVLHCLSGNSPRLGVQHSFSVPQVDKTFI
jgi:hypothetical protein